MFAEYLVIDEIVPGSVNDRQIWLELNDSEDVANAVARLDGETHTLLVTGKDGCNLAVSGGSRGMYRVCSDNRGSTFLTLVRSAVRDPALKEIRLTEGGTSTVVPVDECVDLKTATDVMCCFAESGRVSPQYRWVPSDRKSS
jgi:hypothetical protein